MDGLVSLDGRVDRPIGALDDGRGHSRGAVWQLQTTGPSSRAKVRVPFRLESMRYVREPTQQQQLMYAAVGMKCAQVLWSKETLLKSTRVGSSGFGSVCLFSGCVHERTDSFFAVPPKCVRSFIHSFIHSGASGRPIALFSDGLVRPRVLRTIAGPDVRHRSTTQFRLRATRLWPLRTCRSDVT